MRVLIVEDDLRVQTMVRAAIERDGHDVTATARGAIALERARQVQFDVAIVDWGLPDLDGLEVCRRLRRLDPCPAVLMLTGRDSTEDRVAGLDAGADDFVAKPFAMAEVLARLRALGRRGSQRPPSRLSADGVEVDLDTRQAWCRRQPLDLTAREFDLLELLVRTRGKVLTRHEILQHVWDFKYAAESNIIDVYVRRLRVKLSEACVEDSVPLIHTVYGVGYRFGA